MSRDDRAARRDAVAAAIYEARTGLTIEAFRQEHGDESARELIACWHKEADEFLAAYDVAQRFPINREDENR